VNAFGGGFYGLNGAKAIPRAWLDGSPFHSFFVPSLYVSWMQPTSFAAGAVIVALAGALLRDERRAQVAPVA
jgi:hypothetical protein